MAKKKLAKYVATTPPQITSEIRAFAAGESVYLDPLPGEDAVLGCCYANAARAAERLGGRVVTGWLIWELPGVYLTAEHHAVVEVEGELIDVSPTLAGERRVLFVADPSPFLPPRPANRYCPLTTDPRVLRYVQLQQTKSEMELVGKTFGSQYMRCDEEATRLLDEYFSMLEVRVRNRQRATQRAKKKANRKRR